MLPRVATVILALVVNPFTALEGAQLDITEFRSEEEKLHLIEETTARWNTTHRWLVEYEATTISTSKEAVFVRKITAIATPGSFYQMTAHFSEIHPWQADPFCQEYFINSETECQKWPFNRSFSQGPRKIGSTIPGSTWRDVLWLILPKWSLVNYSMPTNPVSGGPIILVEVLRAHDSRLLKKPELLGGETCAVFDRSEIDRIWIATNKGLCLMRWDLCDPRSKRLLNRTVTEKVDEVAQGLWLPTEYRVQSWAKQFTKQFTNSIQMDNRIRILRCAFNGDVHDELFTPVHGPGSIQYDEHRNFRQISAGGQDLLSNVVDFLTRYLRLPSKPISQHRPYMWLIGGLIAGIGVSCCVVAIKRHYFRGHRNRQYESWAKSSRSSGIM